MILALALAGAVRAATPAPPINLKQLDGAPISTAQLKGKVVLLDFWASWCTPCLVGMPKIAELQSRLGKRGLVVLGVTLDDDRAKLDAYLAQHRAGMTVVLPTADFNLAYGQVLKLKDGRIVAADKLINANLPSWVLIDRAGRIAAVHKSSAEEPQVLAEAEQLVARP